MLSNSVSATHGQRHTGPNSYIGPGTESGLDWLKVDYTAEDDDRYLLTGYSRFRTPPRNPVCNRLKFPPVISWLLRVLCAHCLD